MPGGSASTGCGLWRSRPRSAACLRWYEGRRAHTSLRPRSPVSRPLPPMWSLARQASKWGGGPPQLGSPVGRCSSRTTHRLAQIRLKVAFKNNLSPGAIAGAAPVRERHAVHAEEGERLGGRRRRPVERGASPTEARPGADGSWPLTLSPTSRTLGRACRAIERYAIDAWGSSTNFFAAPLSKSLYPCGASSRVMTVALTAFAICTLSWRIACINLR